MTVLVANLDVDVAHARLDAAARGRAARDPRFALRPRALARAAALGTLFGLRAGPDDTLWLPAPVDPARLPAVPGCHRPPVVDGPPPRTAERWGDVVDTAVRANDRTEWCRRGLCVPGARIVASGDELAAALPAGRWVVKAPFGAAGRRRALGRGADTASDGFRAAAALIELFGRAVLEPWLEVSSEIGASVERPGADIRLHVTRSGPDGRFVGIDLEPPEHVAEAEALVREVGAALAEIGHAGRFGVDLLVHRVDGRAALALAEVNARWTFGALVRDLAERALGRTAGGRFRLGVTPPAGAVVLLRPAPGDPVAAWLETGACAERPGMRVS